MVDGNRKPYSFGDTRQLPNLNNNPQEYIITENAFLCTKDLGTATRSPKHASEQRTNIALRRTIHRRREDNTCWYAEGKETAPDEEILIDYACLDDSVSKNIYSTKYEPCGQLFTEDYTLWPSHHSSKSNLFSPTQLQNILMGKEHGKPDGINSKISRRNSGDKGKCEDYGAIPSKKAMLADEATTKERNIKQFLKNEKTMHCVRRLFPTNEAQSPGDSESDSEFCKNLSQGSSSQSESNEWAIKA